MRVSIARLVAAVLVCGCQSASAEIVINEIFAADSGRTLRWDADGQPHVGSGAPWWTGGFDDSAWRAGDMPIGYGISPIATDVGSVLRNVSPSVYARHRFIVNAADAASDGDLVLHINANDGFIAWINGREVARTNMGAPKAHIYFDQIAYRSVGSTNATTAFTLGAAADLLVAGDNVIAIQVANATLSGNLRLDLRLVVDSSGLESELVPFGSSVRYFPGLMEPSSDVHEPALFDIPAGPHEPSDWVELHNSGPNAVDLADWSLSDDADEPGKWRFPAGASIPPGGFLVVLADGLDGAAIPGATYLHAGFSLDASGEFLGLFAADGTPVDVIAPGFPRQFAFHSHGIDPAGGGGRVYFATPTPGAPNGGPAFVGRADAPDFDHEGGFHEDTVILTLSSTTPGAVIRYTTNGTEPTETDGTEYTAPLTLERISTRKGHVIRARAFAAGHIPSRIRTHTFLIGQDPRVRTAPALVYAADLPRSLYDPYGALAIDGGRYVNSQWQPADGDDYNNVINRGRAYERPIHAEFYFPDGRVGFRTDCGVRVAASSYSRPRMVLSSVNSSPWPADAVQKPSFNLHFRDEYGNPSVNFPLNGENARVDTFEQLRARAGKNDILNPFIIDELVRRMSRDMGQPASTGVISSLYVNGDLKGFYNLVERLRTPFFRSHHDSPDGADWDVLQFEGNENVADGDKAAWNDMIARLRAATTLENWQRVLEVADVVNMADYFLLNIYMATWDWPQNNWVAARERSEQGRYRLYVWDAEGAMNNRGDKPISHNVIDSDLDNGSGELRDLWRGLVRWEEFRILFSDRINLHLFNGGVLDDQDYDGSHLKALTDQLVGEFSDLLRLLNNQAVNVSAPRTWTNATAGRRTYLFGPRREDFRSNGLWPVATPPRFSRFGGSVPDGFPLVITNDTGEIVFTTDGTDPRLPGGAKNPTATSQPGSTVDGVLVEQGATWRYLDDGTDPGSGWKAIGFDDSGWPEGSAPIGFGGITDTTIATEINADRNLTVLFRRTFDIEDASSYLDVRASLHVDDGAVVYINGIEAIRDGMPDGAVTLDTPANTSGNEGVFDDFSIDPGLLVDGRNVVAVSLHNSAPFSSDMVLDLRIEATRSNPDSPPLIIRGPVTVKARSFDGAEWSGLTEADFTVDTVPASPANLAIVEMLYNPVGPTTEEIAAGFTDGDQFEYLIVRNIGATPVDLHGVRFVEGIAFDFDAGSVRSVAGGQSAILVSDLAAFRARFGTGWDARIAGQYAGRLNNGGERIRLIDAVGATLHDFVFDNAAPWPDLANADGHSIRIIDPTPAASHGDGANWAASTALGGSIGATPTFADWQGEVFSPAELADPAISGPEADPDRDGMSNFGEFALGTPPLSAANGTPPPAVGIETLAGLDYLVLTFTRPGEPRGVTFGAEVSVDLATWVPASFTVASESANPDGSITVALRSALPIDPAASPLLFVRLRMSE